MRVAEKIYIAKTGPQATVGPWDEPLKLIEPECVFAYQIKTEIRLCIYALDLHG